MQRSAAYLAVGLVIAAAVMRVGMDSYNWLENAWAGTADDSAYWLVALSPLVLGAVAARWWAVFIVGAIFALSVLIEQALWEDDPRLSGMDDLDPLFGIVLVPLPMALAALGLAGTRIARRLRTSRDTRTGIG